jgi:L-rhamnose mutarotase
VSSAPAGRRICFLLRVRPERAQEYRERHAAVWPEMLPAMTSLQEIFHLD